MARDETPITLAGRTIGLGLCVPGLLIGSVTDGGLAPVVVAAATAALVGVPAAQAEWRAPVARPGMAEAAGGTALLAGMLLVAASVAPLVRAAGAAGVLGCVAFWTAALALVRRVRAGFWIAGALLAIAGGRAVYGTISAPGVTLLTPIWSTWPAWLGPAIVAGVLAGGAGLGPWIVGPKRVPGHDETPWAVGGAAILLTTLWVVQAGARFEATLGTTLADPGRDALLAGAALLGAAIVVAPHAGTRSGMAARAAAGAAATLWLAGPGFGAVPLVLRGAVPCLAALVLAHAAWLTGAPVRRSRPGWSSVAPWLGAIAAIAGVVLGPPPMPGSVAAGAAGGLLLAIGFWIVATRAVTAAREAA